MKKLGIIVILLSNMLFLGKVLFPGYCEETYKNLEIYTKIIKGEITDISYVGSKITVRFSGEDGKEKQMTFEITEKTKVLKTHALRSYDEKMGDVNVSFSDLMQGDEVIVEYYDNPKISGTLAAKSIELIKE